jgi:hypothetical protein
MLIRAHATCQPKENPGIFGPFAKHPMYVTQVALKSFSMDVVHNKGFNLRHGKPCIFSSLLA